MWVTVVASRSEREPWNKRAISLINCVQLKSCLPSSGLASVAVLAEGNCKKERKGKMSRQDLTTAFLAVSPLIPVPVADSLSLSKCGMNLNFSTRFRGL